MERLALPAKIVVLAYGGYMYKRDHFLDLRKLNRASLKVATQSGETDFT